MRILNKKEIDAVHDKWGSDPDSEDYITMLLKEQVGITRYEIANRLNDPCPQSGEEIYKCPRCVRQLRDELLADKVPDIRQKVREEINGKLYHPPIVTRADVSSEALAGIMVKVRNYYQIVFDEATGEG